MDTAAAAIDDPNQPPQAEATARAWVADGWEITLQGTVVHAHAHRTVATYCAAGAVLSATALRIPDLSFPVLAIIGLSAIVDMNGGSGWIRNLRIRQAAHNVIAWPRQAHGPQLLIAAPSEQQVPMKASPTWLLQIPLGLLGLAGLGCALSHRMPDVAQATLMTTGICLALISVTALCWRFLSRGRIGDNPARQALEVALTQVARSDLKRIRCAFALIGGELGHPDGIETLLRNYRHRLQPENTRVLILHPDSAPIAAVHHERRFRPNRSDGLLLGAMRRLGLPGRSATTAAARAQRAGWRAAAMTVAPDQIHAAAGVVKKIAEDLDADLLAQEDPE